MTTPLDPNASNKMVCSTCGWKRVVDHTRFYRGGHTHPVTSQECHGMLEYSEVSPQAPEMFFLSEVEPFARPLSPGDTATLLPIFEDEDAMNV